MEKFDIRFFALTPINSELEYYNEFDGSDLPKYIQKAKKGEIKHIQVCCCETIELFNEKIICSKILEF